MGWFSRLARPLFCLLLLLGVTGCTVYAPIFEPADGAPAVGIHAHTIEDAVPRVDPVTRAGNKNPYTVAGKTYHLLPSSKGYHAEGIASWYGTKFHGRPTANGERYSLYQMTAAHKTLPIPAYARVTNLENGRTAIVRINDRGPFHDNRIIDLSYAAAVKLGYADKGTARVRVEVIDPAQKPQQQQQEEDTDSYFLQVGAFRSLESANRLRAQLMMTTNQSVKISPSEPAGFFRVQVGPLDHLSKVQALSELLIEAGHGEPRLLKN